MKFFTKDNQNKIELFLEEMFFVLCILIKFIDEFALNIVPIYLPFLREFPYEII
jgi:hypothetical protein